MNNKYEMITGFVTFDLNNSNTNCNAIAFDESEFEVRIVFQKNHRALYNRLLMFCAEHDITILSTDAATLTTVVGLHNF